MNILNKRLINLGGNLEIAFELILEFQSDFVVDAVVDAVVIIQGGIIYSVNASLNTALDADMYVTVDAIIFNALSSPLHSIILFYFSHDLR
jgi:hypothetical protein